MTYSDIKLRAKIDYLTRLLKLRVRLMKYVEDVEVEHKGDIIRVRWIGRPHPKKISNFEEIEFPVAHLGKRIEHYRRKFKTEFRDRHKR